MATTAPLALGTLSRHTDIAEALRSRTPFGRESANLRGRLRSDGLTYGRLSRDMWKALEASVYVIYSYQTPIAWLDADGTWTINANRYSASTSRQQSKINAAISTL